MSEDVTDLMIDRTVDIVNTYLGANALPVSSLPELISSTFAALTALQGTQPAPAEQAPIPAVSVKKSITPDFLISLVDGKKYKSLKRHLSNKGYSPQSYREAFGLPADYPMVAPNYAAARSALAKAAGLGRKPGAPLPAPASETPSTASAAAATPAATPVAAAEEAA